MVVGVGRMIMDNIKDSLATAEQAWPATAHKNSMPNAAVVVAIRPLDDGLVPLSDRYFLKPLASIQEDPKASSTWWGDRGGLQIKGTAAIHTRSPVFRTTRNG